jgi:serine/threonine-protein kinase HipA
MGGAKSYPTQKLLIDFARNACGLSKRQTALVLEQVVQGVEVAKAEIQCYAEKHTDFEPMAARLLRIFKPA